MSQRTRQGLATGWLVAVAVLAGGCAADEPGPDVIVPGSPGEPAEVRSADDVEQADPRPSEADVRYLEDMVVHHEQAVLMTDLATDRSGAPPVRAIAARINGTQLPEIAAMQQLLSRFEAGEHGGHGSGEHGDEHSGMPGMATPPQLEQLRASSGADFDALFLDLMVTHHLGALSMAEELLGNDAVDVQVELLASDVIATQNAEIRAMEAMSAG